MAYAGCAIMLLLGGIGLGRTVLGLPDSEANSRLVDLRIIDYDPSTETVRLSVSVVSNRRLEGQLHDRTIRDLLAASLRGKMGPGVRLEDGGYHAPSGP